MNFIISSENLTLLIPTDLNKLGNKCFLAISTLSSNLYPPTLIIFIRSFNIRLTLEESLNENIIIAFDKSKSIPLKNLSVK